jgi:hypothetical protein
MYFDVYYVNPENGIGTHYNVPADNAFDAAKISACMLSVNSPWHPIEFKITNVTEASDKEFVPHVL